MQNPFSLAAGEIEKKAREIRKRILRMNAAAGQGHTGADLSETDILASLYFNILRYSAVEPEHPDRDRFILSKGHGAGGLYCTLAEAGLLEEDPHGLYLKFDSPYPGHPVHQKIPFVEVNTGALGHGLSIGTGLALSAKISGREFRVFVLLGDGELQEGSNWEAAMSASHYGLDNLVAIVDRNTLQLADRTETIMGLEPLDRKWESFGFHVVAADGNDPASFISAVAGLESVGGRPHVILARTIKGRGVSFIEDRQAWHHKVPDSEQVQKAIEELE
jgi:transketolase